MRQVILYCQEEVLAAGSELGEVRQTTRSCCEDNDCFVTMHPNDQVYSTHKFRISLLLAIYFWKRATAPPCAFTGFLRSSVPYLELSDRLFLALLL